jgi:hypothetical protein
VRKTILKHWETGAVISKHNNPPPPSTPIANPIYWPSPSASFPQNMSAMNNETDPICNAAKPQKAETTLQRNRPQSTKKEKTDILGLCPNKLIF